MAQRRRQCVHAASSSQILAPGQALATFHSSNVLLAGLPMAPLYPLAASTSLQSCRLSSASPWLRTFVT